MRHGLQQVELRPGERRVGADHDDGGVDVRYKSLRGLSAPPKNGAQTGRIHEAHPCLEEWTGDEYLDTRNTPLVFRVALLRDVFRQGLGRNREPGAGPTPHSCEPALAVTNDRRHRGHRHDSSRQHLVTNECIKERGLAALELAHASDVEAPLGDALGQGRRLLRDPACLCLGRQRRRDAPAALRALSPSRLFGGPHSWLASAADCCSRPFSVPVTGGSGGVKKR